RIAGGEEAGVAGLEAELQADRLGALLADILGDGAGAFDTVALLAPEDVAEARLAFALRPGIHPVAEGARAAGRRGNRPHRAVGVAVQDVCKDLESGAA